ncbi:MAG: DNA gyrase inhibitor YacG [Alphaproteobacteria bacterium]|nr:DNA gyrase inhibitor YacG [Alphaproteobacteria bacterium]
MSKCPICHKEQKDAKYKPFCSKRCADIDLGNWFGEKYTIPVVELDDVQIDEMEEALNSFETDTNES